MVTRRVILFALFSLPLCVVAETIQVVVPSSPPFTHIVQPNFLGISFELSFLDEYFGDNTSTTPTSILNYLAALRSRTGDVPLRLRIGGNSMDTSIYVPTQTSPMLQLIAGAGRNDNDQPVNYGPELWDVLDKVSFDIGGVTYLIGLSLRDPNDPNVPLIAAGAVQKLGGNLDGFLLGNEPDLYTRHGDRPNIQNYTTDIYIDEFKIASNHLTNTSAGDILDKHDIGGPTMCCAWNLDALLDDGYTSTFADILKYISLQHYPQNNCVAGQHKYDLPYYTEHANVVTLSAWQGSGIAKVLSNQGQHKQQVIMSEFNTVSCGGIPTISDTFAAGTLWTIDYALQMASVGYSAACLHTRERGISYNLFTPPDGPNRGPGSWTTNPPYYAMVGVAEALRSKNGSIVADLNIGGSARNTSVAVSGYAVYDAVDSTVQQLVLFNWANVSSSAGSSTSFSVPSSVINSKSVTVKYLVGDTMQEHDNIGWGGETLANVGDGTFVSANTTWAIPNVELDCSKGCTIDVPAPGMAVVFGRGVVNTTNVSSGTGTIKNITNFQTRVNFHPFTLSLSATLIILITSGSAVVL